ncbi:winged helix DNA-binding protein [Psychromarinibacter sp. C21-152]|uniref:Winged helix DNA-binding protein n=1 Tax=Psychromarinibacter sediminicola TaxID=3033385 RepID=A0AAE3T7K7_9RHOB|nr:MarR family transcriptional regulator [Psychromarinibacter sediminicola]MDF0599813.1 winged helix DNA-binding protein [Psychromarinibacter sediminicola]
MQEGETITSRDDAIAEFLESAGIGRDVTDAALEIDAALQAWRRRMNKRELGTAALRAFGLDAEIDLAQLDVLIAIWGPSNEFGPDKEAETMVATVAARLRIDPSRASRLVSELIGKGLARRAVSQEDARRTIVELTERGHAIVAAVRRFKFLVMGEFLSGWTEEERRTFVPLLERFVAWTDEAHGVGPDRFADEVAEIADQLNRRCAG